MLYSTTLDAYTAKLRHKLLVRQLRIIHGYHFKKLLHAVARAAHGDDQAITDQAQIALRRGPLPVVSDKAFDVHRISGWCRRRGVRDVLPHRRSSRQRPSQTDTLDRSAYRRRVATGFEKLAMVKLVMV